MKGGESSVALVLVTTMERVDFRGWWSVRLLRRGWFELPHWKLEMGKVGLSLSIIYISWSFRPSVRPSVRLFLNFLLERVTNL
jgi:hypothetical protein